MRRGTILIVVSGLCAVMASLAIVFMTRMRGDAEESTIIIAEAQARIMLMAACDYVLEGSRLGWDVAPHDPADPHQEGFGWLDVRDGSAGPNDQAGTRLWSPALVEDGDGDRAADRPAWPAPGSVARCPMPVLQRPPYAIQRTAAHNPVELDQLSADFALPYLLDPDPQPASPNGWPGAIDPAGFATHVAGDPRLRPASAGLAWFRCRRERESEFVVTAGAGASLGFRDWDEVVGMRATAQFPDRAAFDDLVARERRCWYRIAWSAAVGAPDYHWLDNEMPGHPMDHHYLHPLNYMQASPGRSVRSEIRTPNLAGTIRWIERLVGPPAQW